MGKGGNAIGQHDLANSKILQQSGGNDAAVNDDIATVAKGTVGLKPKRWYNRGGIQGVSEIGMGLNVALTPILFVTCLAPSAELGPFFAGYSFTQVFLSFLFFNVTSSFFVFGMRTLFCLVCVPVYMTSFIILATLDVPLIPFIAAILLSAAWRVAVCMSVCLHRYAAHAAFKCGPGVQLMLNLLGCGANQGGPIWWAAHHRCHHKYCEMPRDPHSALMVGTERAFSFFLELAAVDEEFVPFHNDNWYLRLVDTWCFGVVLAENLAAYYFFGKEGLYASYASCWICQTITLWFNVANHPESAPGKVCKASNVRGKPTQWYPAFQLLHLLHPMLGKFAGEIGHDDHHDHPMLALRDATDMGYYGFILPLKKMGLVWDVRETRSYKKA